MAKELGLKSHQSVDHYEKKDAYPNEGFATRQLAILGFGLEANWKISKKK